MDLHQWTCSRRGIGWNLEEKRRRSPSPWKIFSLDTKSLLSVWYQFGGLSPESLLQLVVQYRNVEPQFGAIGASNHVIMPPLFIDECLPGELLCEILDHVVFVGCAKNDVWTAL